MWSAPSDEQSQTMRLTQHGWLDRPTCLLWHTSAAQRTGQAHGVGPEDEGDEVDQASTHGLHQHRHVVRRVLRGLVRQGLALKVAINKCAGLKEKETDGRRLRCAAAW